MAHNGFVTCRGCDTKGTVHSGLVTYRGCDTKGMVHSGFVTYRGCDISDPGAKGMLHKGRTPVCPFFFVCV